MNNRIRIRVLNSSIKFINYLVYNNVNYSNLQKLEDCYLLDIDFQDLELFDKFKFDIVKYYGINRIIYFIKSNIYVLIGLIFGLFILFLLQSTIFEVNVISDNENVKNQIVSSLKDNGIYKYKRKKSFKDIQEIKNKILEDNSDILEWIEIEEVGCNYVVELTPRVKGSVREEEDIAQNIVAKKDGLILYVNIENGVQVKDKNDYVKKGDVIISGSIYKGEKFINNVKAKGKVYAEVWYTSRITMPFKYVEYKQTGKIINHYYIDVFGKQMTLIGKYNSEDMFSQKELLIDKPYLFFDLYKETKREYKYKMVELSEDDAFKEAIKRSDAIISRNLKEEEYIICKKVLKKEIFSSKMVIEVFYKVYEDITDTSRIEEVTNDS